MAFIGSIFSFMFGWLPGGLWIPVWAIISAAVLIIIVKILIALVTLISKAVMFFLPG